MTRWLIGNLVAWWAKVEAFLHNIVFADEEEIPVLKRDSLDISRNNQHAYLAV
jgi:hypothetical protein